MAVRNHIKSLNFGYVGSIHESESMEYLNAMASFIDKDTLVCSKDPNIIRNFVKTQSLPNETDKYYKVKAKKFVIATGTRPQYLPIKGS